MGVGQPHIFKGAPVSPKESPMVEKMHSEGLRGHRSTFWLVGADEPSLCPGMKSPTCLNGLVSPAEVG